MNLKKVPVFTGDVYTVHNPTQTPLKQGHFFHLYYMRLSSTVSVHAESDQS